MQDFELDTSCISLLRELSPNMTNMSLVGTWKRCKFQHQVPASRTMVCRLEGVIDSVWLSVTIATVSRVVCLCEEVAARGVRGENEVPQTSTFFDMCLII